MEDPSPLHTCYSSRRHYMYKEDYPSFPGPKPTQPHVETRVGEKSRPEEHEDSQKL